MEEQKDEYIMTRRNKNYTSAIPFPTNIEMEPIGKSYLSYKERHGTPRQSELQSKPSIASSSRATIALFPDKVPSIALKDMEGFDRIWVMAGCISMNRGIPLFYLREVPEYEEEHWLPELHRPNQSVSVL